MNLRKLYQWVKKTSKGWEGVNRHFKNNVTVFSRGVVCSQSSQIRKIASVSGGRAESRRRRLQRFVKQSQPMEIFYREWTKTVIKMLKTRSIVLIVDETKLKARLGVMMVGVVYEGRCIPLAWRIYQANDGSAYPKEGQVGIILTLLKHIQAGMPNPCRVRVLADRGIGTSPKLMQGIKAMGWTFLFRVTKLSKVVLSDGQMVCFYDQIDQPGQTYHASGQVFKKRVSAHVRVLWGEMAKERWALVTNDPTLTGWEYAQRMWIEEAFRDLKSYGWRVEDNTYTDAQRMTHLWILLVVAYAWMLFLGAAVVVNGTGFHLKRRPDGTYIRRLSLFREGCNAFLSAFAPP